MVNDDKLTNNLDWLRQELRTSSVREPVDVKKDINELRMKLVELLKNRLPSN